MSKSLVVFLVAISCFFVGCADEEDVRREGFFEQQVASLRTDLDAEIKAKKAHAVREEQYKQRLKQLERDYAKAIAVLGVCKK